MVVSNERLFEDYKIIAPRRRANLWTCTADCGWTNTSTDTACQRCGAGQVDGYGFRI